MATFKVAVQRISLCTAYVEAESEEEALASFEDGYWDDIIEEPNCYGDKDFTIMTDTIEIQEE